MEGEREKRQRPVQGRVGVRAKGALAELAALRKSGGKRVTNFELVEEEPVYDVVDEEQYAQIVKKRRDQGGACGRGLLPGAWPGVGPGGEEAPSSDPGAWHSNLCRRVCH